jgi:hypothetical protein
MAEKVSKAEAGKKQEETPSKEPKKLSKAGEWLKAHPNGLEVIYIDWRAVMK